MQCYLECASVLLSRVPAHSKSMDMEVDTHTFVHPAAGPCSRHAQHACILPLLLGWCRHARVHIGAPGQVRCRTGPQYLTLHLKCYWPTARPHPCAGVQEDSCPDYMLKAEDCLRAEEGRVASYLHINSKTKLMSQVFTLLTLMLNNWPPSAWACALLSLMSLHRLKLFLGRCKRSQGCSHWNTPQQHRACLAAHQLSSVQVENELLAEYEGQLLEKEHSGCAALLQDDKVPPCPGPLPRAWLAVAASGPCSHKEASTEDLSVVGRPQLCSPTRPPDRRRHAGTSSCAASSLDAGTQGTAIPSSMSPSPTACVLQISEVTIIPASM